MSVRPLGVRLDLPRLVVFDMDGTLVDSQATIVACGRAAFEAVGLAAPAPEAIRRIVGLSLHEAMTELLGYRDDAVASRITAAYRDAFLDRRAAPGFEEPLFAGTIEALDHLVGRGVLLGVATGKAMRGLRAVIERHGLERYFDTLQTADLHPSKPHPSMVRQAMAETGSEPGETVMIGDTTFDIVMARAAGADAVGVIWGNHPPHELEAAGCVALLETLDGIPMLFAPGRS